MMVFRLIFNQQPSYIIDILILSRSQPSMSFLFQSASSFQSLESGQEKGFSTPSTFFSSSPNNTEEWTEFPTPKAQSSENTEKSVEMTHDDMFESVKEWFNQKNIKIGNPEEIIEKAKMAQRQTANNKINELKQELSQSNAGLRERRLKRSLTLMI